jgi:hypothetical protein
MELFALVVLYAVAHSIFSGINARNDAEILNRK